MQHPEGPAATPALRWSLLAILLGVLLWVCVTVTGPFFIPLTWALILAYVSWPAYQRLLRLCRNRSTWAALAMTSLVALALVAPLLGIALLLQAEISDAYQGLLAFQARPTHPLPDTLRKLPWLGDALQKATDRYAGEPLVVQRWVMDMARQWQGTLLLIGQEVSRDIGKLLMAILTLFFFYRDGAALVRQVGRVLRHFFGARLDAYILAAGTMTRAVIYGLLVTAVAQGTLAGIGFALFRVQAPVLLGVSTALASIVPVFGTFLVWGTVGAVLVLAGHFWQGVGLLAWGSVLVNPVDNVLRPLLIGHSTQMPFLLILFGVVGGLAAYGLVGLFIGPVALAVATAVWREWLTQRTTEA
jgi:predicted PurR-regulated permease PerM